MTEDERRGNRGRGLPKPRAARGATEEPTVDADAPRGPAPPPRSASSEPSTGLEGVGGTLDRLFTGVGPQPDPNSTELPPLPPLSPSARARENAWPPPEREESTLAEDPESPPKPRRPDAKGPLAGSFDEVGPAAGDPDALFGPIDEFTLSLRTDAGLAEELLERAPPRPPADRPARPAAAPAAPPQAPRAAAPRAPTPVLDPLTTGVVRLDDAPPPPAPDRLRPSPARAGPRPLSDATAALVMDGLDDRPANDPSIGLPEVEMPPPDTARARGLAPAKGPPAIALDPGTRSTAPPGPVSDLDEVGVEAMPPRREPPPSSRPDPRPSPRSAVPAARPRPESRPSLPAGPTTSAVSLPARSADPPARAAPPRAPAPPASSGGSPAPGPAGSLDQLLTLADEPPEREDTIGASLELLRLVDASPVPEETVGGSLERIEVTPNPRRGPARSAAPELLSIREAPPAGEESLSAALEPVAAPSHRPPEPPPAGPETRPIERSEARAAELSGPPPGHRPLQSGQLRRPTWRPPGTPPTPPPTPRRAAGAPAPSARRAAGSTPPAPRRPAETMPPAPPRPSSGAAGSHRGHDAPQEDPAGSPMQDPVVVGAATVIGFIVLLAGSLMVVLALVSMV